MTDISTRELGETGIRLTRVGFGAASLGNLYRETTDEEAHGAMAAAWNAGIRYFDTAPHYGLGLSEIRLGREIAGHARDEYVLSTKVGRRLVPHENPTTFDDHLFIVPGDLRRQWDFSRDGILRSLESSLQRLGVDRIDIAFLHDPDASGVEFAAETGAATLIELRDEGVLGAVGIGSNSSEAVAELFARTDIDVAMLAGRYTLLEPTGADAVFEAAAGRSIIAVGVFNSGLLANNRASDSATYNYAPAEARLIARANELAEVCERHGATLPQAALAFPLRHPSVISVAVGMRDPLQVVRNVELFDTPPSESLWQELRESGWLPG